MTAEPIASTEYNDIKVAVLTAEVRSGLGGAERFYKGLLEGVKEIGCHVERVAVPADEPDFAAISSNYEYCRRLDVSNFDVVISTKAPTFAVSHPNHVMYLMHTIRVFDDMFEAAFPFKNSELLLQRAKVHSWDFEAISHIKARFAQAHEVANRLYRWRGIRPEVIHPPLGVSGFRQGEQGDYFFLPGRLHPWKRIDLVIKAIRESEMPLRLLIAGEGEAEQDLKQLVDGDERIEFFGRVSDQQLIDLYANALAVPFVPVREDYGYVTLEAFASGKPVLTCTDSGEPVFFIRHKITGLVCTPTTKDIKEGLEWLFTHRKESQRMGEAGAKLLAGMSWRKAAKRLVDAALDSKVSRVRPSGHMTVIDMQPIYPPVGGGRLRLLGLYHNLGGDIKCQYVGTYDWPGEKYRCHRLSESLEEIDVPLSDEHHSAARALSGRAGGKTVIDISFSRLATLSPQYLEKVRESLRLAEVVVFSHPWVYPLVAGDLSKKHIVVYDSHNVEGFLRAQLLDGGNPIETDLLRQVVEDEYQLGCRADLILACSQEDLERFNRLYGFDFEKIRVVPNGVMAFTLVPPSVDQRKKAREHLKLSASSFVVFFIGSQYPPNMEAADFIVEKLADRLPEATFVIAGGVGGAVNDSKANVIVTGPIDEKVKSMWLRCADIAVNPMFSGSGTNIKMFDFMAMGLPTVTTAIGARGIDLGRRHALIIVEPDVESFVEAIQNLRENMALRLNMGVDARACVEDGYAWERISHLAGTLFASRNKLAGQKRPFFSIVVPTFERHDRLSELMGFLQSQIERDFEVIIVDQSKETWSGEDAEYGFPFVYYHSQVIGAVRARNTGALLSQGCVIAFTDDDCNPDASWLLNARKYFENTYTVGVEGSIISDHLNDPDWRPVTNQGFEGVGFMTANLLVRSSVFQRLGGFDLDFDRPHFREDTDFGWRMQELGNVPYGKDVKVFHPAQARDLERESVLERASFFSKDSLLFNKNPEHYKELFLKERHYLITPGFRENLLRGFQENKIAVPGWMKMYLDKAENTEKQGNISNGRNNAE